MFGNILLLAVSGSAASPAAYSAGALTTFCIWDLNRPPSRRFSGQFSVRFPQRISAGENDGVAVV
jgi:hypothetical protein